MITGCPDCPHQGDGNSQAGLQAHINRVPGPTAADRPSVTDNARADEQRSEYTVQETAAYFARKVQRVSDRIRSTDYQRSVSDIVGLDSIQGFLDRVARDDLDVFAAGRAETTTEWGVHDFGGIQKCPDEQNARDRIAACRGRTLVRREVTAWTEVDR